MTDQGAGGAGASRRSGREGHDRRRGGRAGATLGLLGSKVSDHLPYITLLSKPRSEIRGKETIPRQCIAKLMINLLFKLLTLTD